MLTGLSVMCVAQLVGGADGDARLDSAAGHPDREAVRMVVAAQELRAAARLVHRGAAELAAPDHQRLVQQPAPLEVAKEGRDRPVDFPALLGQVLDDVVAGARCRGNPSPSRRAGHSARPARPVGGPAGSCWRTTRPPGSRRILAMIDSGSWRMSMHVGNGHLHPEGQLVLADPRQRLGIAELGELVFVELPQCIERAAAVGAVHPLGIADIQDRDRRPSGTARPDTRWADSRCSRGPCRRSGPCRR